MSTTTELNTASNQTTHPTSHHPMKTLLIAASTALLALATASAQTVVVPAGTTTTTTETTTVTTGTGVLDVYEPGTKFVVKETAGPVAYSYGPEVVYATPGGVVLTEEQIRTRIRAGLPVKVEYLDKGGVRVIRRVVVED